MVSCVQVSKLNPAMSGISVYSKARNFAVNEVHNESAILKPSFICFIYTCLSIKRGNGHVQNFPEEIHVFFPHRAAMFDCQNANEGAHGAQLSGSSLDPQLGPVLLFGTGGALVEARQRIFAGFSTNLWWSNGSKKIKTGYFSEIWWGFTIWLFKLHSEAMYNFYRS